MEKFTVRLLLRSRRGDGATERFSEGAIRRLGDRRLKKQ